MDGRFWRRWLRRTLRTVAATGVLLGLSLLVIGVCVYQQAQNSDTFDRLNGPMDALLVPGLVVPAELPSPTEQARLDEAIRLYKLGYARRIVLPGMSTDAVSSGAASYLIQKAPDIDPSVLYIIPVADADVYSFLVATAHQAPNIGQSFFVVADPYSMLRTLKLSRDAGLATYAAPVKANMPVGRGAEWAQIWDESWRYLQYITLNRP